MGSPIALKTVAIRAASWVDTADFAGVQHVSGASAAMGVTEVMAAVSHTH
ncbi:hypothetical protein ABA31_06920 [Agrococcus baldri]|uniref:Uncharacterized protein n=1 Tax=Agrococcus baldri TaxID=153730 RepID=A0AA87RAL4_9MICO|nr:hypothetical protein ABA31_06920 [Agrococcus baldri]